MERGQLKGHSSPVQLLAFSPDGKTLVSASSDQNGSGLGGENESPGDCGIRLWDIASGKELRRFRYPYTNFYRLCFAPDGETFTALSNPGNLILWDTLTGRELRAIARQQDQREIDLLAAPGGRPLANFSLDGKNSEYALRDVATGFEICRTQTYEREQFALAPDGHTVVLNRAKLVDSEKLHEKKQASAEPPYPTPIRAADELEFRELASWNASCPAKR